MNDEQLSKLKAILLRQLVELRSVSDTLKEAGKPVKLDQAMVGRLSRMDAMQGQQMAMASTRRHEQQIVKTKATLKRIKSEDYGLCFKCQEEIDIRRLMADPTITRCMECVDS